MENLDACPLISSRKNPLIKKLHALASSNRLRQEEGAFLIEGARLCADAILSGAEVQSVFFTQEAFCKYKSYFEEIERIGVSAYQITAPVADLLSQTKRSQEVYALCKLPALSDTILPGKKIALEHIQDPANMGAVMRTAEALGFAQLLLIGQCCDLYAPKLLRASMGAVFRLPVAFFPDSETFFQKLAKSGAKSYAAVVDANATPLNQVCFSEDATLVIGNEGNGLTAETIEACTVQLTIPMSGRAESLNAAAAATILMWAATQQTTHTRR